MRLHPFGETAVLVELVATDAAPGPEEPASGPLGAVIDWHADLLEHPEPGQVEALASAKTVLVRFANRSSAAAAMKTLPMRVPASAASREGRTVTVDTVYSGEDLAAVAQLTGLSLEAVVKAHSRSSWVAAFGGFAPGFMYLTGGDPVLVVPRRSSPRVAVPAGAVALAGEFSAVYPRSSPGGWQLIGHTETALWDPEREQPALLSPGDTVRFRAVREHVSVSPAQKATSEAGAATAAGAVESASAVARPTPDASPILTVISSGLLTTVQDLGRPGLGDLGVTRSGAADRPSAAQANRLLGLPEDAPVLETLLGGLTLRAETTVVLALAGAVGAATIRATNSDMALDKRPAPVRSPFALYPGQTLTLDTPDAGLRGYVGVRIPDPNVAGGVARLNVSQILGSSSTDTLSGLGPTPLEEGQVLWATTDMFDDSKTTRATAGLVPVAHPEPATTALPEPNGVATLRVTPGPRADWFDGGTKALASTTWRVSGSTDRVGARLEPATAADSPLTRTIDAELSSEGMVPGAIQVPPDGNPVIFLADHPVTGGYPVIATVRCADLGLVAQLPPGTHVTFEIQAVQETQGPKL